MSVMQFFANQVFNARYLARHKWLVWRAGRATGRLTVGQLLTHDLRKLLPDEWFPYAAFRPYFGARYHDAPAPIARAFRAAWKRHLRRNPHHPEFWARRTAGGPVQWTGRAARPARLVRMPRRYAEEAALDWVAAGLAQGKPDVWAWYQEHGARFAFHPATRHTIERVLADASCAGLILPRSS